MLSTHELLIPPLDVGGFSVPFFCSRTGFLRACSGVKSRARAQQRFYTAKNTASTVGFAQLFVRKTRGRPALLKPLHLHQPALRRAHGAHDAFGDGAWLPCHLLLCSLETLRFAQLLHLHLLVPRRKDGVHRHIRRGIAEHLQQRLGRQLHQRIDRAGHGLLHALLRLHCREKPTHGGRGLTGHLLRGLHHLPFPRLPK